MCLQSDCALARREHYLKVGEDGTTKVVHRVATFDARGCITSVISQLDVMRCALRRQAAPTPCPVCASRPLQRLWPGRGSWARCCSAVWATLQRHAPLASRALVSLACQVCSNPHSAASGLPCCRFLLAHADRLGGVLEATLQDLGALPRHMR